MAHIHPPETLLASPPTNAAEEAQNQAVVQAIVADARGRLGTTPPPADAVLTNGEESQIALQALLNGEHPMAALAGEYQRRGAAPQPPQPPRLAAESAPAQPAAPRLAVEATARPQAPAPAPEAPAEETEVQRAQVTRERVEAWLAREGLTWADGLAIIEAVVEGNRPWLWRQQYRAGRWIVLQTRSRAQMTRPELLEKKDPRWDEVSHRTLAVSLLYFGNTDLSQMSVAERFQWIGELQEMPFYLLVEYLAQFDRIVGYLSNAQVLRLF